MGKNIEIFRDKNFDDDKIIYGFTGRKGGNSSFPYRSLNLAFHVGDDPDRVEKNRKHFADGAGLTKKINLVLSVHGDNIYVLKMKGTQLCWRI
jgi:copper oxidase (laccase) domain-containing protein